MSEKQEENNEDLKIKGNKALKAKTSSFQFFASFFSRQKIYHISPRPNKTNYIGKYLHINEKNEISAENVKHLIKKQKSIKNIFSVTKSENTEKENENDAQNENLVFEGYKTLQNEIKDFSSKGYQLSKKLDLKNINSQIGNNLHILSLNDDCKTIMLSNDQLNYEKCKKCLKPLQ